MAAAVSLIRDEWCRAAVVREHLCSPDIKLLCVSLRAFPQISLTVVCFHPKANFNRALEIIFNLSQKLEPIHLMHQSLFLGILITVLLKKCLHTYYQYVNYPITLKKLIIQDKPGCNKSDTKTNKKTNTAGQVQLQTKDRGLFGIQLLQRVMAGI